MQVLSLGDKIYDILVGGEPNFLIRKVQELLLAISVESFI